MLKALVFQLLDTTVVTRRWFQFDSTCAPYDSELVRAVRDEFAQTNFER